MSSPVNTSFTEFLLLPSVYPTASGCKCTAFVLLSSVHPSRWQMTMDSYSILWLQTPGLIRVLSEWQCVKVRGAGVLSWSILVLVTDTVIIRWLVALSAQSGDAMLSVVRPVTVCSVLGYQPAIENIGLNCVNNIYC